MVHVLPGGNEDVYQICLETSRTGHYSSARLLGLPRAGSHAVSKEPLRGSPRDAAGEFFDAQTGLYHAPRCHALVRACAHAPGWYAPYPFAASAHARHMRGAMPSSAQ